MKGYRFVKEDGGWYIDLPEYLDTGGSKADLAMVAGADTMLNIIAGQDSDVLVQLDVQYFEGADILYLTEICDPAMGGGYYFMPGFEQKKVNQRMWLCDVTNFVFGHLPEKIFVKRVNSQVV